MKNIHDKTGQAGFIALEMIAGLVVFLMLLPVLYSLWDAGMIEIKKRAVAEHLTAVTNAAISYGRKHYNALIDESTASTGRTISINNLKSEQFLLNNFNQQNPWGQSYNIYSREPKEGELQLVVLTTGGLSHDPKRPKFANQIVPSTAALAKGGFIPTGLTGQPTGQLQGVYNAWRIDLGAAGIPAPSAGHLGSVSNLSSFDVGHDYLYRVEVPGHPELNEMWTELDMTDHAIENVKEIQFVPHNLAEMTDFCADPSQNGRFFLHENEGLYICRDGQVQTVADTGNSLMLKNATMASHGDKIPKPTCPPGVTAVPEIFMSTAVQSAGSSAAPIVASQAYATNLGSEWQVNLRILTADPTLGTTAWINPSPDFGKVMVFTLCN